ncbi:MAG: GTP cyclohydrolase I FolE [Fibrobacterales bacterium]
MDKEKIKAGFKMILEGVGEDPNREGLLDTPRRVADMYEELFAGLHKDPNDLMKTCFAEDFDEMILVKDIEFQSMCEHHFLPFKGVAHVAYIPKDKVVGLSKIARVVEHFARQPQIQERMTREIANFIQEKLDPQGVAVVLESEHMCMTMRGIKKPGSKMLTSQLKGVFRENQDTREEFMSLIK